MLAAYYLNKKDSNIVDNTLQDVCRKLIITIVDTLQSGSEAQSGRTFQSDVNDAIIWCLEYRHITM